MSRYNGNTQFYNKAVTSALTLRDVFSDVFKKHRREDGERLFVAGTSDTTPSQSDMLQEWKKPWLFIRLLGIGLALIFLYYMLYEIGFPTVSNELLIITQAAVIPLTVLVFYWEMNIPRNIPIYEILIICLVGGALSMFFNGSIQHFISIDKQHAQYAAFLEEPAKLAAVCIFLRKPKYRYTLNGVLIGGAVGCGFAVIETIDYALRYGSQLLLNRGVVAPGGHVLYAAIYAGALAGIIGNEKLQVKHLLQPRFLAFFSASIALHFAWNWDLLTLSVFDVPVIGNLKYLVLIIVGWIILLRVINVGMREVLVTVKQVTLASVQAGQPFLYGISGTYTGMSIPLSAGSIVFGRDQSKCNLLFSDNTAGVSRQHCTLTYDGRNVCLNDDNSSNGTFLGTGERLKAGVKTVLQTGQRFYLANPGTMFELRL